MQSVRIKRWLAIFVPVLLALYFRMVQLCDDGLAIGHDLKMRWRMICNDSLKSDINIKAQFRENLRNKLRIIFGHMGRQNIVQIPLNVEDYCHDT